MHRFTNVRIWCTADETQSRQSQKSVTRTWVWKGINEVQGWQYMVSRKKWWMNPVRSIRLSRNGTKKILPVVKCPWVDSRKLKQNITLTFFHQKGVHDSHAPPRVQSRLFLMHRLHFPGSADGSHCHDLRFRRKETKARDLYFLLRNTTLIASYRPRRLLSASVLHVVLRSDNEPGRGHYQDQ